MGDADRCPGEGRAPSCPSPACRVGPCARPPFGARPKASTTASRNEAPRKPKRGNGMVCISSPFLPVSLPLDQGKNRTPAPGSMLRPRLFVRTRRGAGSADLVLKVRGFSPAPDVNLCQAPQPSNARPALSTPCPDLSRFHLTSGIDRFGRQFTEENQGARESSLPAFERSIWRAKPLDAPAAEPDTKNNPVRSPELGGARRRGGSDYEAVILTPHETFAILNSLLLLQQTMVNLDAATGLCYSEITGLRWGGWARSWAACGLALLEAPGERRVIANGKAIARRANSGTSRVGVLLLSISFS